MKSEAGGTNVRCPLSLESSDLTKSTFSLKYQKQNIFISFKKCFCSDNLKTEMGGKCPPPNKQCDPVMEIIILDSET